MTVPRRVSPPGLGAGVLHEAALLEHAQVRELAAEASGAETDSEDEGR